MLNRHSLNLQHHPRSSLRQPPRKLPRILLTAKYLLLVQLPAEPLLALPNRHSSHRNSSSTSIRESKGVPTQSRNALHYSQLPTHNWSYLLIDVNVLRIDHAFI